MFILDFIHINRLYTLLLVNFTAFFQFLVCNVVHDRSPRETALNERFCKKQFSPLQSCICKKICNISL